MYGILHDQITYSISPEYYTEFKFIQFGLASQEPEMTESFPRLCAAYVGFMATWWFGLFVGFVIAVTGLRIPRTLYFRIVLKAIFITISIAALTAFIGFIYGYFFMNSIPPYWHIPAHLIDEKSFIIVGTIHNFSYTGGAIGTLVGMAFLFWQRHKSKQAAREKET